MSRTLYYCLVRYTPDRGAGERINVGVVLFDPENGYLEVAIDERGTALSCAFGAFSYRSYRTWAAAFRSSIRHVGLQWSGRLPFPGDKRPMLSGFLAQAQSSWGAAIEASEERRVASYAPNAVVLEDLYDRYVAGQRPSHAKGRAQFSDSKIWETFHAAMRKQKIAPLLAKISVDVIGMSPIEFDHSIKVERWRAFQPVSFDLAEDDAIKSKAARWAGLTSRMDRRKDFEGIYYLVAPPQQNDLFGEYQAAKEWLRHTNLAADVIEVASASKFAEAMEEDLRQAGRV